MAAISSIPFCEHTGNKMNPAPSATSEKYPFTYNLLFSKPVADL